MPKDDNNSFVLSSEIRARYAKANCAEFFWKRTLTQVLTRVCYT